jgi:hypothetical protein
MTEPQPTADVGEAFAEAYRNYCRTRKEAWRPDAVQEGMERAFVDYVRALLQAGDVMKRFEAHADYYKALQEAWLPAEARERLQETYTAYVRAWQAVWAQLQAAGAGGAGFGGCQAAAPAPGEKPTS